MMKGRSFISDIEVNFEFLTLALKSRVLICGVVITD